MSKVGFCRQKSKLVLFSHKMLCCKTFKMTYYLFIYDVPNRILKYSSVGNYFWRKAQSKFGKYASLAMHTLVKLLECRLFLSTNHFVGFIMKTRPWPF